MRMTTRLTPKLRKAVRWLRRNFPVTMPVTVRVLAKQPGLHGLCLIGDGRALLRITADADTVMIESLIEEWCHVLRHETPLPEMDAHDQVFWAIYAQVSTAWRE